MAKLKPIDTKLAPVGMKAVACRNHNSCKGCDCLAMTRIQRRQDHPMRNSDKINFRSWNPCLFCSGEERPDGRTVYFVFDSEKS